ncbi:MAG: hypothetical protein ACYC7D_15190 [Nitrososphaerales archaeon]
MHYGKSAVSKIAILAVIVVAAILAVSAAGYTVLVTSSTSNSLNTSSAVSTTSSSQVTTSSSTSQVTTSSSSSSTSLVTTSSFSTSTSSSSDTLTTTSTSTSVTSSTTSTSTVSTLTIHAENTSGVSYTGLYTALYQNGTVVATGFTPAQFTVNNGEMYSVEVQNSNTSYFQYWLDTGSVTSLRNVTTTTDLSLNAILCNGPPGTCPNPTPVNGITVYANRVPAPYWASCFALACSLGTGPGASMEFALYNSSGNIIQTALVNEQGYTFLGLNSSATYHVYPENCDLCHGSTHDVVFDYWGNNSSSTVPIAATVGTSLEAWYACTNGCTGI